jgi:hypothetical protein
LRDGGKISLGFIFASFEEGDAVRFVELLCPKVSVKNTATIK